MKTRTTRLGLLAATAIAVALPALAQQKAERFPESQYRHDVMEVIKYSGANIGKIARGQVTPEQGQLLAHAEILAKAAAAAKGAFAKDTRGTKGHTEAKDKIWEDWQDFAGKMDKFAGDTEALVAAVRSGESGRITPAVGKVFQNCKACHDSYKDD